MIVALPTVGGKLCAHFGHCEKFALVEVNDEDKSIASTNYSDAPPHQPGVLPVWLHEQGVNVVIAGGMGQRAQGIFGSHGISVIVGAPTDTPENIVKAYVAGTLEITGNICDH